MSQFRGEFEREMRGETAMDPAVLVRRAIAGIEAGRREIRPGVANLLRVMSRVAPGFMLKQMTKWSTRKDAAATASEA